MGNAKQVQTLVIERSTGSKITVRATFDVIEAVYDGERVPLENVSISALESAISEDRSAIEFRLRVDMLEPTCMVRGSSAGLESAD